ncbi:hypothetical protein R3P38DRAFT_3223692 [Favolaschia claudopus]|uniref:Uncharacterized protein n=1 Tax=Favolaschia claudopus TaxID=2862362 RepID=A0AAV9ZW31_9AGAR
MAEYSDPIAGDTIPHRRVTTALRLTTTPLLLRSSSTDTVQRRSGCFGDPASIPVKLCEPDANDPHHNGAHSEGFTPLKQENGYDYIERHYGIVSIRFYNVPRAGAALTLSFLLPVASTMTADATIPGGAKSLAQSPSISRSTG